MERHPELYEKAKEYEKFDEERGVRYTWSNNESLDELSEPERVAEIKRKQEQALQKKAKVQPGQRLYQIFNATLEDEDDTEPCTICNF
jgi:hypothetical protein